MAAAWTAPRDQGRRRLGRRPAGGDEGPGGAWAIAMQTVWDTDADATASRRRKTALGKAGGVGRVLPGAGGKTRWVVVGSDAATLGHVANVLGLAG